MIRSRQRMIVALCTAVLAVGCAPPGWCAQVGHAQVPPVAKKTAARSDSTSARFVRSAPPATADRSSYGIMAPPRHGQPGVYSFGGHAELRAAQDRVAGIANPDWMSVPRVNAFAWWRAHPRIELTGEATYDRATDDLVAERAQAEVRIGDRRFLRAGIIQPPLGRVNFDHDAPRNEFDGLSYVATEIIGVPNPQLGIGFRGTRDGARGASWTYDVDLVSGYNEGVITKGSLGTRLPMGRDNFGGDGHSWAITARIAKQTAPETEIGLAVLGGAYNPLQLDGVTIDPSRAIAMAIADGRATRWGFRFSAEAAAAYVDVPNGLEGLYAERQWAASSEVVRTLRAPIAAWWPSSALVTALRFDTMDYDAQVPGDSKTRLSASLNLRRIPWSVLRAGWYYEHRRDRFNNLKPAAGLVFGFATYL